MNADMDHLNERSCHYQRLKRYMLALLILAPLCFTERISTKIEYSPNRWHKQNRLKKLNDLTLEPCEPYPKLKKAFHFVCTVQGPAHVPVCQERPPRNLAQVQYERPPMRQLTKTEMENHNKLLTLLDKFRKESDTILERVHELGDKPSQTYVERKEIDELGEEWLSKLLKTDDALLAIAGHNHPDGELWLIDNYELTGALMATTIKVGNIKRRENKHVDVELRHINTRVGKAKRARTDDGYLILLSGNSVFIPKSALVQMAQGANHVGLSVILFKNSRSLIRLGTSAETLMDTKATLEAGHVYNSEILAVSVNVPPRSRSQPLFENVTVTLKLLETATMCGPHCVSLSAGDEVPTTDGCTAIHRNQTHLACECSHLTSFVVHMHGCSRPDWGALRVVEFIFDAFSILLLLVCMSMLLYLGRHVHSRRLFLYLCIVIALLLGQIFFLVGFDSTDNTNTCAVMASLLHFLFLSAIVFTLLEEVDICYGMFNPMENHFDGSIFGTDFIILVSYCLVAFGLPFIIVATSVVVWWKGYGDDNVCWLKSERGMQWSFSGPAIAFLGTCVILTAVNKGLITIRSQTATEEKEKQIWNSQQERWKRILPLVLLQVLAWILGNLYFASIDNWLGGFWAVLKAGYGVVMFFAIYFWEEPWTERKRIIESVVLEKPPANKKVDEADGKKKVNAADGKNKVDDDDATSTESGKNKVDDDDATSTESGKGALEDDGKKKVDAADGKNKVDDDDATSTESGKNKVDDEDATSTESGKGALEDPTEKDSKIEEESTGKQATVLGPQQTVQLKPGQRDTPPGSHQSIELKPGLRLMRTSYAETEFPTDDLPILTEFGLLPDVDRSFVGSGYSEQMLTDLKEKTLAESAMDRK